jgi:hypothetical protein
MFVYKRDAEVAKLTFVLQIIGFIFIMSGLVFLGIALYQILSKIVIIKYSGWIALVLIILFFAINVVIDQARPDSSIESTTTTTLAYAKQMALIIAENKAAVTTRRAEIKRWKNELKVELDDIDRNTSFVRRMYANINGYDVENVYKNLITTANNLRICAKNVDVISKAEFEDKEDEGIRKVIVSDIMFACEEYATAYEDSADSFLERSYENDRKSVQLVRFHVGNGNQALLKAMLQLIVLVSKYGLKY